MTDSTPHVDRDYKTLNSVLKTTRKHLTTRRLTDTWSEQENGRLWHNLQQIEILTHFYQKFWMRGFKILLKMLTGVGQNISRHVKLQLYAIRETSRVLHLEHNFVWCWNWDTLRSCTRNTFQVLKCCGGEEGWRSSVGPIVWEMSKYCIESRRTGISCLQEHKEG